MPELNLLTVNPVTAGIESAQRMDAQRQRGQLLDMQVGDMRAKRAQERAATDALNNIYATGGPDLTTEQVHRRLAADPNVSGGRRLESLKAAEDSSLRRTQVEAQARERDARQFKVLLENGMDAAAAEVAKRMGMTIPPDFWTNQAKRRALLEKLEIEDKQAGINQKRASAGASQALAESRRVPEIDEYDTEQGVVRVERGSGKSSYVLGPDGNPIKKQAAASAGRDPLFETKRQAWLRTNPGDEQGALEFASGRRQATVAELLRIAQSAAKNRAEGEYSPERQRAVYDETYRAQLKAFGIDPDNPMATVPGNRRGVDGPGARSASSPAAAGEVPMRNGMAAPRTPEERDALPPGTRYLDPNGNVRVRR